MHPNNTTKNDGATGPSTANGFQGWAQAKVSVVQLTVSTSSVDPASVAKEPARRPKSTSPAWAAVSNSTVHPDRRVTEPRRGALLHPNGPPIPGDVVEGTHHAKNRDAPQPGPQQWDLTRVGFELLARGKIHDAQTSFQQAGSRAPLLQVWLLALVVLCHVAKSCAKSAAVLNQEVCRVLRTAIEQRLSASQVFQPPPDAEGGARGGASDDGCGCGCGCGGGCRCGCDDGGGGGGGVCCCDDAGSSSISGSGAIACPGPEPARHRRVHHEHDPTAEAAARQHAHKQWVDAILHLHHVAHFAALHGNQPAMDGLLRVLQLWLEGARGTEFEPLIAAAMAACSTPPTPQLQQQPNTMTASGEAAEGSPHHMGGASAQQAPIAASELPVVGSDAVLALNYGFQLLPREQPAANAAHPRTSQTLRVALVPLPTLTRL